MQQRIFQGEQHVRVINEVLGKDKIIDAPKQKKLSLLEAVDFGHDQKKLNGNRKNYTRTFTQLKNLLTKWLEYRVQPDYFLAEFDRIDAQDFLRWLQTERKLAKHLSAAAIASTTISCSLSPFFRGRKNT